MGIRGGQIQDGTVEGVDIKDGTLTNSDFAVDAAIDQSKISQSTGWMNDIAMGKSTWQKVVDPGTGNFAVKESGWTADSFSGGFEVDFSSVVPVGTKAIRVPISFRDTAVTQNIVYYRKSGDTNISNTPHISEEFSHRLTRNLVISISQEICPVIWLSDDYKAQFALRFNTGLLYVQYPIEYTSNEGQFDDRYYTESELDSGQLDNRYYTETESDTLFSGKDSTVLADYPARKYSGTITLSEPLTSFEYLVVKAKYYLGNQYTFIHILTSAWEVGEGALFWTDPNGYANWVYTNATTLTFFNENTSWIRTVYGVGRI